MKVFSFRMIRDARRFWDDDNYETRENSIDECGSYSVEDEKGTIINYLSLRFLR